MAYKSIALGDLSVNRANDRHGELANETAAIAWLLTSHESRMRKLARDIAKTGGLYEPPLVFPGPDGFTVFDGNRRITCLKLLANPRLGTSVEWQRFFADLKKNWQGGFPSRVMCRIETDRDVIDAILFRRHTGSQGGVGQSNWDGRMKTTFVNRTGKGGKLNVADEIEDRLKAAGMMPKRGTIPRANLNRLLSAEAFRNRVGISTNRGTLQFIRNETVSLGALARIADDLALKRKTLDDVWDVDRKSAYLDELEKEGVLPTAADTLAEPAKVRSSAPALGPQTTGKKPAPRRRATLIPPVDYGVAWPGRLQRHHAIWDELQNKLHLDEHPNAIAVLCRVLLELSVDNYIRQAKLSTVAENDALVRKLIACAEDLRAKGRIEKRYLEVVRKARTMDAIVSVDTLNKYVHSSSLAPAADHLTSIWDCFSELVVHCLNE